MSAPLLRLYGAPCSLYTAKVRAALRKNRVGFREDFASHPDYRNHVFPAVQNHRVPVVAFADGTLVQDSTEILDALQARGLIGAGPDGALRIVELFIEAYADRALLRPAMHYRWNFQAENGPFVVSEFARLVARGDTEKGMPLGTKLAGRMSAYLPPLGITPETIPAIEAQYLALLDRLNRHFAAHPYLLGGSPSRADYGMMGALYAHLGRDPYPAAIMQTRAPLVFRWVERMNAGEDTSPEFPDTPPGFFAEVPASLQAVIDLMSAEFGAELAETLAAFDRWLAKHPEGQPGQPLSDKGDDQPSFGPIRFPLQGTAVDVMSAGHSLWMLQRVQDAHAALDSAARAGARALLGPAAPLLEKTLPRRLGRQGNKLSFA